MLRTPAAILTAILVCLPAKAHEYWIEPLAYRVAPDEPVVARLRNGEKFRGVALPYLPAGYARLEIVEDGASRPIEGRLGDEPAITVAPADEGLAILVLETVPSTVTYREAGRFEAFLRHKDAAGALGDHARRGLPETGFSESYTRHVKALVAVGGGAGADRPLGLATEIVAGANPYTDALSAGMPLSVLLDGAPRAGAQVELFSRAPDGTVAIALHRTDAAGRVTVPVAPGHAYFADAVVVRALPNDDPAAGPVWESLWAGLSFAVPEAP